ncbi:outer membrane beta-barrel protein [Helicobacter cetorum]|uniref:Outer membrane protein HorE n=1 Tax=Helicobacter cetorum (strain ATCC BAA-540 / CCUG 52418 / MIT 99-5656) TaxID=1163745 RepID=I0ETC7_HELCM|nr:outer membrane beta-barrel protein [Helicobacter cetorum]AFI06196.1 outer membrane protein HorE [Helicobacter cetorum MIT 99-5656]
MIKKIACILSLSATLAIAGEVNGFFMGAGYQQGAYGSYKGEWKYAGTLYGLNAKLGFQGFANKWFGARIYGFLDWFNTPANAYNKKDNLFTYGGAGDIMLNIIPLDKFALGIFGGVQLAGNTWMYPSFNATRFQFLFNVGGRMRIGNHSAFEAGVKFPMLNQGGVQRYYSWYVDYVYTF